MLTRMSAKQARNNFSDLLGAVFYGRQAVAVEKKGRIFAMVINPEEYQNLKQAAKGRFLKAVNEVQKINKNKDADKTLKEITAAVEQVRSQRYAGT